MDIQTSSVNVTNGNLFDAYEISPDRRLPVTLSYNSRSTRSSRFGQGWNDSLDIRLISSSMILINPDGREDVFTRSSDGSFTPPPGIHDELEGNSTAGYTLHHKAGGNILFNGQGRPLELRDSNGNITQYSYAGDLLASVTGPYGSNTLTFTHDGSGHVTGLSDALGRSAAFEHDAAGNLVVIKEIDPEGNATVREYDDAGNTVKTVDPMGNETLREYAAGSGCSSCGGGGRPVKVTDALGNVSSSTYDAKGRLLTETSPDGAVTTYEYDAAGNLIKETDALGNIAGAV